MNILVINPILYTCEGWNIPRVKSIKDTMIYNMCRGFKSLGHKVTLCAAKEIAKSKNSMWYGTNHLQNACYPHLYHFHGSYGVILNITRLILI